MAASKFIIFLSLVLGSDAFHVGPRSLGRVSWQESNVALAATTKRARSRVSDPSGPTPDMQEQEIETVNVEDIPELKYDPDNHPVPHQPWRRGDTAGCEAPIDADWRQEAERIIYKAVEFVGGTVIDVTWYLTQVIVHLDDEWEKVPRDYLKTTGAVINVREPEAPEYKDPADPNPEDIYSDGEEVEIMYEKDLEHEEDIKSKMYVRREEGDDEIPPDANEISLYVNQETREDDALRVAEEAEQIILEEQIMVEQDHLKVDTAALSTIGGAILEALECEEDRLRILDRHEVILTSPGAPDVLESQKQFDSHRGFDVAVETQDPWDSNRTLRGKLVDRNSMDIILNVKGRMVTIPQNFVKCVRLPASKRNQEADTELFEEMEEDYDVEE